MHDPTNLPHLITAKINSFLAQKSDDLEVLGEDIEPLLSEIDAFLQGGKRLRGRFLLNGYEGVAALNYSAGSDPLLQAAIGAAASLELFHAAALIHDDIIDNSDTRRGRPSAHAAFASVHRNKQFSGDPAHFGLAAAILAGDLLQSWADELFDESLDLLPSREAASSARKIFNTMRSEVAGGQYLDVLEEARSSFADHKLQLERSTRVLVYKSAKYSVQAPLMLGAAMAGGSTAQMHSLAEFGLPIGVAFQLRDDVLGIFGEEKITGKPIGDDLREGKRTILVTLAREALPAGPQRVFDDMHGTPDLDEMQIKTLQRTIEDTNALERVEQMIKQNAGIAREALFDSALRDEAVASLIELADRATQRNF